MFLIIDCGSDKVPRIGQLLTDLEEEFTIKTQDSLDFDQIIGYQGIIISGNPVLISDSGTDSITDSFAFISNTQIPVLGICFGHQVVGLVHGSEVNLGKEDRSEREIDVLQDSLLFEGLGKHPSFQQDHCEEITLPSGFIHLATSSHCEVEAMQHAHKPLYGVQFHPESSGENGKRLLENFCKLCE